MQRYVPQFWTNVAQPDIYIHEVGYYIIRFQNKEDMLEILYKNNKPIILKAWTHGFNLAKKFPTKIPLWVEFPNLPMMCWGRNSLSRIDSVVGKPIYADEYTAKQTRISIARMLIEVNISNPLPNEITVLEPNGRQIQQEIQYDWRPKF
ncbi:hypothetical protein KY285_020508 [Solanum tuberosum]|nr:hypothetical protein KY285_020508 [Solanum tuberosum]